MGHVPEKKSLGAGRFLHPRARSEVPIRTLLRRFPSPSETRWAKDELTSDPPKALSSESGRPTSERADRWPSF
jgi:hypothetical protein